MANKNTFFSELENDDEEKDKESESQKLEAIHEQSEKDKYLEKPQTKIGHTDSNTNTNTSESKRVKRQSDYEYTPTKTRCPLLLVADYRFFQEMGASNTKTTISYLVSFSSICSSTL